MKWSISNIVDLLSDLSLFIAALFLLLFGAYLLGLEPLAIFILLHITIIIIFAFSRKKRIIRMSFKKAENLHNGCTVGAVIVGLIMLSLYSKTEAYLDKKLLSGKIIHFEVDSEDSEGNYVTDTEYKFILNNNEDSTQKNLILFWVLIISFGGPVYMYIGTKYILNKVEKREKFTGR